MNWFEKLMVNVHQKNVLRDRYQNAEIKTPFYFKTRFLGAVAMLILALFGVILTDFFPHTASRYWFYVIPLFALINLTLSWQAALQHKNFILLWHELLHWSALLIMVFLVAIFLNVGTISDVIAGMMMLSFLALTTLLAGIHFDSMLLVIGFVLLALDVVSAVFIQFALFIIIPFIILAGVLFFWRTRSALRKSRSSIAV